MSTQPCSYIPLPLYPVADCIFLYVYVTSLTLPVSPSLFISEQNGTDGDVLSIAGGLFPQAGETGRGDDEPPRQWLWAWAQADSAVQRTHPQSLSEWERPPKESQRLAGAPSSPKRGLAVAEWTFLSFLALGNKLLPHIEAIDPEPPGSGLKGSTRRGKKGRGHPECEELVWVASHLSVSAVHS